jgi:hypothetical protein
MQRTRHVVAGLCAVLLLPGVPMAGVAREALDAGAACRLLQKTIAKRDGLPESGPPGMGWFCDITPSKDPTLYVIALRSARQQPYSNLMGWYAVARASGSVYRWDIDTQRAFPLK